jgi:transposase
MNKEKTDERGLRRKLFRLFDKGKSVKQILQLIPRARAWLYKWKERYECDGRAAAPGQPTVPKHSPQAYPNKVVQIVLQVRKRLQRAAVGLIGAKAIRRELQRGRLLPKIPSLATINRLLHHHGLVPAGASQSKASYYPAPKLRTEFCFHSMDWMLRYLAGGEKVFIFHTIDLQTHGLAQTLAHDKSLAAVRAHALAVWQTLGLPDFLQIDNDSAFTGLGKKGRIFGKFVRLALHLGIELIFIPPAEAKRNHLVEGVNQLFHRSFWAKNEFTSFRDVERKRGRFLAWYQAYEPPALAGLTIRAATAKVPRRKLSKQALAAVPESLPLTRGRIHFLRQVSATGEIEILKERWKVGRKWAGRYVLATLFIGGQRLQIYARANAKAAWQLRHEYVYDVGEKVVPLQRCYWRKKRAMQVRHLF